MSWSRFEATLPNDGAACADAWKRGRLQTFM